MKSWRKINLYVFCGFVLFLIVLPWLPISKKISSSNRPWMLSSSVEEDSLSDYVKGTCQELRKYSVLETERDSSKTVALIMVDAWGLPIEDSLLANDFAIFSQQQRKFAVHKRLANRTVHAEHSELRDSTTKGVFVFGGDSLEYDRKSYMSTLGYEDVLLYGKTDDSIMVSVLDSVLQEGKYEKYAWTTQSSREGDRKQLHRTLKEIAELAKRHTDVQFIVQGTHRPILGTPEVRRKYHPHWVPVVILN